MTLYEAAKARYERAKRRVRIFDALKALRVSQERQVRTWSS